MDRDTRIRFSVGHSVRGTDDSHLACPSGLAFDRRGFLVVADSSNNRVQIFSIDDGSFVSSITGEQCETSSLSYPFDIAIDHELDRIVLLERDSHRVQIVALNDHSFLHSVGRRGRFDREFETPRAVCLDDRRHRIIVADTGNARLQVLSSIDGSFEFTRPCSVAPHAVCIDSQRERIIVAAADHRRVQVLSSIDRMATLFEFSWPSGSDHHYHSSSFTPTGVCVDNHGRIITADFNNHQLVAFTSQGHYISSFDCQIRPYGVAFDEHRGLIAFSAGHRVFVIEANRWLCDTYEWRPERHAYAPLEIKRTVWTIVMLRAVAHWSTISLLPNELLFELFALL